VVAGGHSIDDPEPKYGMVVTGFAHPDGIWTNAGGREDDVLVLSKAIGTGIVSTAIKRGEPDPGVVAAAVESMTTLNAEAAALVRGARPHAVTDVTGFGLVGHAREVAAGAGLRAEIDWAAVRLLPGVRELLEAGHVPGGTRTNLELAAEYGTFSADVDEADRLLACDAQTSGGLLVSLPAERAAKLPWPVIGRLVAGAAGTVAVA
jgi:selenium donor protein